MRFDSSRQMHEELYTELGSILNEKQRQAIEAILREHLSGGGVSHDEVNGSIRRELRALHADHTIGQFEYDRLMEFLLKE